MWIYLPATCCPSAPATAASTSELTLPQAERAALCATLNAKHSLPRFWRLAWRKKPWLRLLSGLTCEPSTADNGVASWISSLAVIRANRSVTPGSDLASVMSGIYGPTLLASLAKWSPASCSSKTSQDTSLSALMLFAPTSNASATELRQDYSRRLKWARRIDESDCLSSAWPTPNCPSRQDNEDTATRDCGQHQHDLKRAAIQWPTATAGDAKASGSADYGLTNTHHVGTTLTDATERLVRWPTPEANDHKGSAQEGQRRGQLDEAAEQIWQTPTSGNGGRVNRSRDRSEELLIAGQAELLISFLPVPVTEQHGNESSQSDQTSRPRLNVNFVEWLMGVPPGWTDFAPSATESCRWSRRMRSRLFGLVSFMARSDR